MSIWIVRQDENKKFSGHDKVPVLRPILFFLLMESIKEHQLIVKAHRANVYFPKQILNKDAKVNK